MNFLEYNVQQFTNKGLYNLSIQPLLYPLQSKTNFNNNAQYMTKQNSEHFVQSTDCLILMGIKIITCCLFENKTACSLLRILYMGIIYYLDVFTDCVL